MIFLDNNATTQVDELATEAMLPFFNTVYANPSSLHQAGQDALAEVERVRRQIGEQLSCLPEEIFFTRSGTEANNFCLKHYALSNKERGNHLITSKIEHASVLEVCAFLETVGFEVTYLDVDEVGIIHPERLKEAIQKNTILVSIAHVNNEIGTIQPLKALLAVCEDIPFHTDAVQSFLKTDFSIENYPVALASFSGHKFHAPKGIGFVFKKKSLALPPYLHGGQQEKGVFAGTENVPYIVALGKAMECISSTHVEGMRHLQEYLVEQLMQIEGIRMNGPCDLSQRVCSNLNFSCNSLEGENILRELSSAEIYVSTGSACSSKHSRISHVLRAIQCPPEFIHGNVRVGLSKYTTRAEVETFIDKLSAIVTSHAQFRLFTCQ